VLARSALLAMRWHPVFAGIVRLVAVLWLVSIVAFLVLKAMPADPAVLVLVERNRAPTAEAVAELHALWGLDRPLPLQYLAWLGRFLVGDWGTSFRTDGPILGEVLARLPVSMAVGIGGLTLAALAALVLGHAAAARPGGIADRATTALSVGAQALPSFWIALLLVWVAGVHLHLIRPYTGPMAERLVLPILLVAAYSTGSLARVVRRALMDVAEQPFFMAARAKGLDRATALRRHGFRHGAVALTAALTPEAAWAIGGTAVAEVVFALPGISAFVVESVAARDFFVLQGYVVAIAAWMLVVHAASRAARRLLDPRI